MDAAGCAIKIISEGSVQNSHHLCATPKNWPASNVFFHVGSQKDHCPAATGRLALSLPAGESAAALLPVVLSKLRSSRLLATTATEEKAIMPPARHQQHPLTIGSCAPFRSNEAADSALLPRNDDLRQSSSPSTQQLHLRARQTVVCLR
jgi:hypothetical protein